MSNLTKLYGINDIKLGKARESRDKMLKFLNKEPDKKWIKKNNGIEYIPIEIIEDLLTRVFRVWHVEVREVQPLFNSVQVTVRVHYADPLSDAMLYQDGVGAAPMQVDQGQLASNMQRIKYNAVQLGVPAAKSYAIKDAVEHIGKLFGRDIGRKNAIPFVPMSQNEQGEIVNKAVEKAKTYIQNIQTIEELNHYELQLQESELMDDTFALLIKTKRTTLENT